MKNNSTLTKIEATIVSLRFGVGTGCPTPLTVICRRYGLSRLQVKQIETRALRKLDSNREKRKAKRLDDWID